MADGTAGVPVEDAVVVEGGFGGDAGEGRGGVGAVLIAATPGFALAEGAVEVSAVVGVEDGEGFPEAQQQPDNRS